MNREEAERIITEYVKPVYGFALKRCKSMEDAEDLSQEIVLKAFRALLLREDIEDTGNFIWTIAHNALSNYYRDSGKHAVGTAIEELENLLGDDGGDIEADLVAKETAEKLQSEIAYLSRLQRRIVIAYYYENRKQSEIAAELKIPEGTVKWHLFEAKKELKRGMEAMRIAGELKFNPIKFEFCGTNGSVGTRGENSEFFRSILSQNIVYSVWKEAKTINEIAEDLGVSPVYVENEAEFLEEYGFLTKKGEKYLCNILLDVGNKEVIDQRNLMYEKASKLYANELYEELLKSGILNHERLYGGYTGELTFSGVQEKDSNFFLWALIPYITACSGEYLWDRSVSFEEAATLRPDGGHNICQAGFFAPEAGKPKYMESMHQWCGPCWNQAENLTFWQVDSEWSGRRVDHMYSMEMKRILGLLHHMMDDELLSETEYAYLAEKGILKRIGSPESMFKTAWQGVWIQGTDLKQELLDIGSRVKEKHRTAFEELKKPYVEAVLKNTPKQLHTMQKYVLQFIFHADGWFLLYCMKELVNNGKLQLPTEEQKNALSTVVFVEE